MSLGEVHRPVAAANDRGHDGPQVHAEDPELQCIQTAGLWLATTGLGKIGPQRFQHDCPVIELRAASGLASVWVSRLHPLPVQHLCAHAPTTVPTNSPIAR
jgi:hypothetical protein